MLFHHIDPITNKNTFLTPVITKGEGKDLVNVNLAASDMVLPIAYMVEASLLTSETRNPAEGVTYRKNAVNILASLAKTGKPGDLFTAYLPVKYEDRNNTSDLSKWVPVARMTRASIIALAEATVKVGEVMSEAETKAAKIMSDASFEVKKMDAVPVYGTGTGRAKKSSGAVSII